MPLVLEEILFLDLELEESSGKLLEIGAVLGEGVYRGASFANLAAFGKAATAICGHNLLLHDLAFLREQPQLAALAALPAIDTLMLSVLMRPDQRKHALHKDYKASAADRNDPVVDAKLSRGLLEDLGASFQALPEWFRRVLAGLLGNVSGFSAFFQGMMPTQGNLVHHALQKLIKESSVGLICGNANLELLIEKGPVELAMVLSILHGPQPELFTPSWLLHQYPLVSRAFRRLRAIACEDAGCTYCSERLDPRRNLKRLFRYDTFRRFEGDAADDLPMQEQAVQAALKDRNFLVIFPTGGGKSITFQLPALIRAEATNGLTVIISPLVSLMKDQVDNLRKQRHIVCATAINGLLSPLERQEAVAKVADGSVNLLYIAPELLRSRTILRLLSSRIIDRFVIDEAHCFSAWGQDFRVDYLYIAAFIKLLQRTSKRQEPIPVSCFTATARKEVIQDIIAYFEKRLELKMQLYSTAQGRQNLDYDTLKIVDADTKMVRLVELLEGTDTPAIVYVSRVKTSEKLSRALKHRGFNAEAYNGKMVREEKTRIQEGFLGNEIRIIVATSAFGMGVDKDNVAMVIHYEISSSLENYVQEAGRAGRNEKMDARCIILFDENDLDKHFELLQGTKLNKKDIDQIWKGLKDFRGEKILKSALEIARKSGWDTEMRDLETRVRSAVNALEEAKYVERSQNAARIFSDSLQHKLLENAKASLSRNEQKLTAKQLEYADRALQYLYGRKEIGVDYLADAIGISMQEAATLLQIFREIGILGDDMDLSARLAGTRFKVQGRNRLNDMLKLEQAMIDQLFEDDQLKSPSINLRELNTQLHAHAISNDSISISEIRIVLQYWKFHKLLKSERTELDDFWYKLRLKKSLIELKEDFLKRSALATQVIEVLEKLAATTKEQTKDQGPGKFSFSMVGLKKKLEVENLFAEKSTIAQYEQVLLYLNFVEAIELLDGLLVSYNRLSIERKELNNLKQFTLADYATLAKHYERKIEQIHIVGEYARRMLEDKSLAGEFAKDYFAQDYAQFLKKYFKGKDETLKRPLSEAKYEEIFGRLNPAQRMAVQSPSDRMLMTAGPGSGKTMVLVHKMASLLLLEDVKPEQFLMLAFSRPAALEFRERISALVPGLGRHIDIFTYHGFAFRLLGRLGDIDLSKNVIETATNAIREGLIPREKVSTKSVIMLDEFQDVSAQEWDFLTALIEAADQPRIIAAGDDDQCIYAFRGASVEYMQHLLDEGAEQHSLILNYRAAPNLVDFSNQFLSYFPANRMKSNELLEAHRKENGEIKLVRYKEKVSPLAGIAAAVTAFSKKGTTALLTSTNEEAVTLHGLLRHNGVPAVLVSKHEGFRIARLQEFVWFTKELEKIGAQNTDHSVTPQHWKATIQRFKDNFSKSEDLEFVVRAIEIFESATQRIYLLDWREYCDQLRVEDVMFPDKDKVFVTTMHKAKGKEFDHVFLLLDHYQTERDVAKVRAVYVALTRAKDRLEIHCNAPLFDHFDVPALEVVAGDERVSIDFWVMECGLDDVVLGHFHKINTMLASENLISCARLLIDQGTEMALIDDKGNKLVQWSAKMRDFLSNQLLHGFVLKEAKVAHVVYWKDKKNTQECRVILPRLTFQKKGNAHPLPL